MNIYVKFEIPKTVREFLKAFFSVENSSGTIIQNVATYTDKECIKMQCSSQRSRSFRETCDCVKTYFPKVTDKTIFRILLTLNLKSSKGNLLYLRPEFCCTIDRPIIYYYTTEPAYYIINTNTKNGIDDKSWSEIFNFFKLTNESKIKEFIKKYKDR